MQQLQMDNRQYRRKTKFRLLLIGLAALYCLWFRQQKTLTGNAVVDDTASVLLGLYICSQPAAAAIDLFFFERNPFRRIIREWSSMRWLALNLLTLWMGWLVVHLGTSLLLSRAD